MSNTPPLPAGGAMREGFQAQMKHSLEAMASMLYRTAGLSLRHVSDLECPDNNTENPHLGGFVTEDGTLASMLRMQGGLRLREDRAFSELAEKVGDILGNMLAAPGRGLQVSVWRDRDMGGRRLDEVLRASMLTAERLGMGDPGRELLRARRNALLPYVAGEGVEVLVWTGPEHLVPAMQRKHQQSVKKEFQAPPYAPDAIKINLSDGAALLRDRHEAFVNLLIKEFANLDLRIDPMDVQEALRTIRGHLIPTPSDWRARLPGSSPPPVNPTWEDLLSGNMSRALWPALSRQIFDKGLEVVDMETVRIGARYFAPLGMALPPATLQDFPPLWDRLSELELPWRLCFHISSGGYGMVRRKWPMAAVTHRLSGDSAQLKEALETARELAAENRTLCGFQATACTWAPNREQLNERTASLGNALNQWGNARFVPEVTGNPVLTLACNVPGLRFRHVQLPVSCAPVSDLSHMLPVHRPATAWRTGSLPFRTADGKVWPYEAFSSEQTSWTTLICAPPGAGKSVLLNAMNAALLFRGGAEKLPRIGIIDIGQSSFGLIKQLRSMLPPALREQAVSHRMRMSEESSVNPFDTPLGARYPAGHQRDFLARFLAQLLVGGVHAVDDLMGAADALINGMYKDADDADLNVTPKGYAARDQVVEAALKRIQWRPQEAETAWWSVVDKLFAAGEIEAAEAAQRYAVPMLRDAATVSQRAHFRKTYGEVHTRTNEPLPKYIQRLIGERVSAFRLLSRPTSFTVAARIIALDLDEVVRDPIGEEAARRTAIMFMLARYMIARDWYLKPEDVNGFPSAYQEFQKQRIERMEAEPKRLCYDEFHRTRGAGPFQAQIVLDAREGRKRQVDSILASQAITDFGPELLDLASSVFLLGQGETESARTAELLHLDGVDRKRLTRLGKPTMKGSGLLAIVTTKNGRYTLPLTLTLGAAEIWAYSTTAEDAMLRQRLFKMLPADRALRCLAERFPSGSAKRFLEQRSEHSQQGTEGEIAVLARELADAAKVSEKTG